MRDQAETLRRLMQEREASTGTAAVVTFTSALQGVGRTTFLANFSSSLSRSGFRVLVVEAGKTSFGIEEFFCRSKEVNPDSNVDQKLEINELFVQLENDLWALPASNAVFSDSKIDEFSRSALARTVENSRLQFDVVLIDAGAGRVENVVPYHLPAFQSVIIITPDKKSIAGSYALVKSLRSRARLNAVSVIVNHVTDGRQAVKAFDSLKTFLSDTDIQLKYLGHWEFDRKITESVIKRKILIDLDTGAPSLRSFGLLTKRMKLNLLGLSDEAKKRVPKVSRFTDEPARLAPGNSAGFWRTLLGEVDDGS